MPTVKVAIKGDATSMSRAGKEAEGTLDRLKKAAGGMGGIVTGALGALGISATLGGLKSMADEFDRLAKLASRLEVPVETLQRLGRVVALGGADVETLARAMTRLTAALGDTGSKGQIARDALAGLGIDAERFAKLQMDEQIYALADAYKAGGGQAEAFSGVLELLGLKAADLIPTLKEGGDALREMGQSMNVLTAEQIKAIEQLNDAWGEFSNEIKVAVAGPLTDMLRLVIAAKDEIAQFGVEGMTWEGIGRRMTTGGTVMAGQQRPDMLGQTASQQRAAAWEANSKALDKAVEAMQAERKAKGLSADVEAPEKSMRFRTNNGGALGNFLRSALGEIAPAINDAIQKGLPESQSLVRPEMLISDLARQGGAAGLTGGFTSDMLGVQKESRDILKRIERKLQPAQSAGGGTWS